MSQRSLIIRIVFTCKLLAVNLHVNKNGAIKTRQKQPTDEANFQRVKCGNGNRSAEEQERCHGQKVEAFMKNTCFRVDGRLNIPPSSLLEILI